MDFITLQFKFLTAKQLFEIYQLRSAVFVVEQKCAYQDVDAKDLLAHHVMGYARNELVAYSRLLPPELSYKEPSIGRVCVAKDHRSHGTGVLLMKHSINRTLELFNNQAIVISAQAYLIDFYTALGFTCEGDEYLEDDIPHITMRYLPH